MNFVVQVRIWKKTSMLIIVSAAGFFFLSGMMTHFEAGTTPVKVHDDLVFSSFEQDRGSGRVWVG
jgi:hypothetical protein